MNPQINVITLGVEDPARATEFYSLGLGCPVQEDHGEFVSLRLGAGTASLALYRRAALAADAGVSPEGSGFRGFHLSAIFDTAADVDTLLAAASRAGGTVIKPAKSALWGGYSGTFADPDGNVWKAASNSKPPRGAKRRDAQATLADERPAMSPKEVAVTLGVSDIKAAKQFYGQGLGCPVDKDYSNFVSFNLGDGSSSLALYRWDALAADAGVPPAGSGFRAFTLSSIADSSEQVDKVLAVADRAGGAVAVPGQAASWGGYSGYFTDPDGTLWKAASRAHAQ